MVVEDLKWPAPSEPAQRKQEVAQAIVARLADALGQPAADEAEIGFVLTPDRADASDRDALQSLLAARGQSLSWGPNGFAIATDDHDAASEVVAFMLDSAADVVTVIARAATSAAEPAELAAFVEALLIPPLDARDYGPFVGIVFDWGEPLKTLDPDGLHPV